MREIQAKLLREVVQETNRRSPLAMGLLLEETQELTLLRLKSVRTNDSELYLPLVIPWASNKSRAEILTKMEDYSDHPRVLISNYINEPLSRTLINAGINFIDALGNISIINEHLVFQHLGNKPNPLYVAKKVPSTLRVSMDFTGEQPLRSKGLILLHAYLEQPELLRMRYREVAEIAGVSLSVVQTVKRWLKETNSVCENDITRFKNYRSLVKQWTDMYNHILRPRIQISDEFETIDSAWNSNMSKVGGYWSGGSAAARSGKLINPHLLDAYIPMDKLNRVSNMLRKKQASSSVEKEPAYYRTTLYEIFWDKALISYINSQSFETFNELGCAPDIVVYADLISRNDPRYDEVANDLLEERAERYGY